MENINYLKLRWNQMGQMEQIDNAKLSLEIEEIRAMQKRNSKFSQISERFTMILNHVSQKILCGSRLQLSAGECGWTPGVSCQL